VSRQDPRRHPAKPNNGAGAPLIASAKTIFKRALAPYPAGTGDPLIPPRPASAMAGKDGKRRRGQPR